MFELYSNCLSKSIFRAEKRVILRKTWSSDLEFDFLETLILISWVKNLTTQKGTDRNIYTTSGAYAKVCS